MRLREAPSGGTDRRGRLFRPAAQGCRRWYRQIGGRWAEVLVVVDGWPGVGPTGKATLCRPISNGDYYPVARLGGSP